MLLGFAIESQTTCNFSYGNSVLLELAHPQSSNSSHDIETSGRLHEKPSKPSHGWRKHDDHHRESDRVCWGTYCTYILFKETIQKPVLNMLNMRGMTRLFNPSNGN
jgi:hypothetical protein